MRERPLLATLLLLWGCAASPQPGAQPAADSVAQVAQPGVQAFVEAQRARRVGLKDFASRGSAEVHWTDEHGTHHEQTQLDLAWREGGGRLALRMDKLGERFAWSGADPESWWVFRLESKPTSLLIGRRDDPLPEDMLSFLGPDCLLELLGVSVWPDAATLEASAADGVWIRWNRSRPSGAWRATRVRVPRPGGLPAEVQLLAADGSVLVKAEHARPLSVEVAGAPPGAWPEVAGTTRFTLPGRQDGSWEVFWDAPGTRPERLKDRLFDLAVLREVLHPDQVRDLRSESR